MTPERISFEDAKREGASFERAQNAGVAIRQVGPYTFRIRILDSDTTHDTRLARERGGWVGMCDCKAHEYHDGPCAHLWAVKRSCEWQVLELADVSAALEGVPKCPTCGSTHPRGER